MANDATNITVNFDSNITKVSWLGWGISGKVQGTTYETTTSGEEVFYNYVEPFDTIPFTVTLNEGYVLDTVSATNLDGAISASNKTNTTFDLTSIPNTVTLTSKKKSFTTLDLSTLNLSVGTHTIKVKAKGDNYQDSAFSNEVSYTVVDSGYSVSCSQFETEAGYEYQYSTDNGSTWSNISNTGLIVSATQIKFRIHHMCPNGTPSATKKQIKSTLLGLNISMTTESTEYVESENFTLTENIDDIQCFSALPGYTVTVDTEFYYYHDSAEYSTDDGESWNVIEQGDSVLGEFQQIKFRIVGGTSLFGIGCSIYSETLGLTLEPERNSTVESDNYVLTQDVDDIVINLN